MPEEYLQNCVLLAEQLQILRNYLDEPIRVLSGYRTREYNKVIGGASRSQHLIAAAADIATRRYTPVALAAMVELLITRRQLRIGGVGIYPSWVHLDTRKTVARWRHFNLRNGV